MRASRIQFVVIGLVVVSMFASHCMAQSKQPGKFQFDDVIYQLPQGYRKGKTTDDHIDIYKSDDGVCSINIFRSVSTPKSVNAWTESKMKSLLEPGKRLTTLSKDKAIPIGSKQAIIAARRSGRQLLIALAVSGKKVANIVVMKTRIPRNKDAESVLTQRLKNEFLPFAMNLRFVSDGAKPLLGRPSRGNLDGTFSGLKYTHNLDLSTNFDQEFYTFSKTGRFFKGLPKGVSVRKIDFLEACNKQPNRCGNYLVKNGKIQFRFADGTTEEKEFTKSERGFKMGQQYTQVSVPADNATFTGKYCDFKYSSFTPGSGIKGGVTIARTIQFMKQGRYSAIQFGSVFGNFENGSGDVTGGFGSSGDRGSTEGSYVIKDGTIRLSDGQQTRICSIVQLGDRLLFIDGVKFLKKESDEKKGG